VKITRVTPIVLADRYVLVRVETDEDVTGVGEAGPMSAPLIVAVLKDSLAPLAGGQDPLRIEALHERLAIGTYKLEGRLQMCALSGLELALWAQSQHSCHGGQSSRAREGERGGTSNETWTSMCRP
jgi:L-alanine-DL-glutamate epimerase-like enolase superfamily enzyme